MKYLFIILLFITSCGKITQQEEQIIGNWWIYRSGDCIYNTPTTIFSFNKFKFITYIKSYDCVFVREYEYFINKEKLKFESYELDIKFEGDILILTDNTGYITKLKRYNQEMPPWNNLPYIYKY